MEFSRRIGAGFWINDVKNSAIPNNNWPDVSIDSKLLEDYEYLFEILKASGYNMIDIYGLLVGHDWPPQLENVLENNRKEKVNKIIEMAHSKSIKVIFGMGIYSWGFDEIIKFDPEVRGTNKSAMCGSKKRSKYWQQQTIKLVLDNFDIDGFHLEASDQGRCSCDRCSRENNVEYYCRLNKEAAIFIKERWPEKYLLVNDCGYLPWGDFVKKDDFKYLYDLSNYIDTYIDNGNHGLFIREEDRREFISGLNCEFGTAGGFWIYTPQRWERLRWFLPYVFRTSSFLKKVFSDGGTACEFYLGPTINPSTEVNIYSGGLSLSDINNETEKILEDTLNILYKPNKNSFLSTLVEVFIDAENAFFNNWEPCIKPFELPKEFASDVETLANWSKETPERSIPGELFLEPLVGLEPGEPVYLKNNMTREGLVNYKKDLIKIIKKIQPIKSGFNDNGRILRIITCINNVIEDISKLIK